MQQYALIVAGGSGARMGSDIPKQFLLLNDKPVLMHTLEQFYQCNCTLVVVLPQAQFKYWQQLCVEYRFNVPHELVTGGETRFHSVKNGLLAIPENTVVAIHDGVRPCVTQTVIDTSFAGALLTGNAIAAVALKDSIRVLDGQHTKSVNRDLYKLIQTPQTFLSTIIKQAYTDCELVNYTDDAAVLESVGITINLVDGDYGNIKITTAEDLQLAKLLLNNRKK